MTAHLEDRAHKSERRIHSGQARKFDKPDRYFRPSVEVGTVEERRVTAVDGDEGTEVRIPVSENAQRRSSSPPQEILNNPARLEMVWAVHCSRRARG